MSKNRVYTLETKLATIKLKQKRIPVKEIQETLNIKSESQVYFWWYWFRDGEKKIVVQKVEPKMKTQLLKSVKTQI